MDDPDTVPESSLDLQRDNLFDQIVLYIATALFLSTILFATLQVLSRNVLSEIGGIFDPSLNWTVPAAKMVLIVGSYWGAAVASRNNQHIAIEFVPRKISENYPRAYKMLRFATHVLMIGYIITITHGLFQKVTMQWESQIVGLEPMPAGVVYLGMFLGFVIMLIYESLNFFWDPSLREFIPGVDRSDQSTRSEGGDPR